MIYWIYMKFHIIFLYFFWAETCDQDEKCRIYAIHFVALPYALCYNVVLLWVLHQGLYVVSSYDKFQEVIAYFSTLFLFWNNMI